MLSEIIIMRSTSCGGKDTWIDKTGIPRDCVLSSDDFRVMLFADRSKQTNNTLVFDMMHKVLESRLQSFAVTTVFNATNLRLQDCKMPLELAKKYGAVVHFVSIEPPPYEVLVERNKKRFKETGFNVPDHVFAKHIERYYNCKQAFHELADKDRHITFQEIVYRG